jgi:hypothetical protein
VATPLSASPNSLNFGTIPAATNSFLDTTIKNRSGSPVTITSFDARETSGGEGFYPTLGGTCLEHGQTLAPNDTCTIRIGFQPTTAGRYRGALVVYVDGTIIGVTVQLRGRAT